MKQLKNEAESLQSCVSVSVTDKEFRIGNLINYRIVDKMDERQEWLEVSEIDYDDLRIFGIKDKINNDYQPIPLTEYWLLKLGFVSNPYQDRYEKGDIDVECDKTKGETILWLAGAPHIKYVHQLQNLYHALNGCDLHIGNLTEH